MYDLFQDPESPPKTRTIKVISLWQPWASLVAFHVKIDETRHWSTNHRGLTAIHAAKTLDVAGAPEQLCQDLWGPHWLDLLPRGAVVAIGGLKHCRPAHTMADRLTQANKVSGNFAHGRFAWRFETVRPLLRPIPLTGRQGLFNWDAPADLEALLGPAADHLAACAAIGWG